MQQFVAELVAGMSTNAQQNQYQNGQRQNQQSRRQKPAKNSVRAVPYVTILAGPGSGRRFNIPPNHLISVGRSKEANINLMIQDLDVSRIHCQLAYMEGNKRFMIKDLSTNGTFYKNYRLAKNVEYQISAPAQFVLAKAAYVIGLGVDYEYR
jgi:pSer/pThr/pTyr-binding forkhead associated (FHA) protein